MPLGFEIVGWWPAYYQAGLHVSLIGGLAMLTLAVSTHVVLGHGDRNDLINGRPWQVGSIAVLMGMAMGMRALMTIEPLQRDAWMAAAAVCFLGATLVWTSLLVPILLGRRRFG